MKRILFSTAIVLFGLSTFAADLEITASPNNPILITKLVDKGPDAPYFIVSSVGGTWNGEKALKIEALLLRSQGLNHSITCYADSKDMSQIFFKNASFTGSVKIRPHTSFTSAPFVCSGQQVKVSPNPFATYNIPVTVTLIGVTSDGKSVKPVRADAQIVIQ